MQHRRRAQASQAAFQGKMAVRVKTDKDSHLLYCTGTRGKVDSLQLHENASNSESFGHTRQQMSFEEETAQGREVVI